MRRVRYCCILLMCAAALIGCRSVPPSRYEPANAFLQSIADADRIVVRDGGDDYTVEDRADPVRFTVTDTNEIAELRENLEFATGFGVRCGCYGYPVIDWYMGKRRLAHTAVNHGRRIWWQKAMYNAVLKPASQTWLVNWLAEHDCEEPKKELEAWQCQTKVEVK